MDDKQIRRLPGYLNFEVNLLDLDSNYIQSTQQDLVSLKIPNDLANLGCLNQIKIKIASLESKRELGLFLTIANSYKRCKTVCYASTHGRCKDMRVQPLNEF